VQAGHRYAGEGYRAGGLRRLPPAKAAVRVNLLDEVASVQRILIARANPILAEVPGKCGAAVKVQMRRNIIGALPAIAGCAVCAISFVGMVERALARHHDLVRCAQYGAVGVVGGFEMRVADCFRAAR